MKTKKINTIFNKEEAKLALSLYLEIDKNLIQIDDQTGLLYYSENKKKLPEMHLLLNGCPTYKAYKGENEQYYVRQLT